jgi:hypothetical protein
MYIQDNLPYSWELPHHGIQYNDQMLECYGYDYFEDDVEILDSRLKYWSGDINIHKGMSDDEIDQASQYIFDKLLSEEQIYMEGDIKQYLKDRLEDE